MFFLIFGIGCFIISIVFFIYYPIHLAQIRRRKATARGTIIKVYTKRIHREDYDDIHYQYNVEFNPGSGVIPIKSPSTPIRKEEGDEVIVEYNPDKPQDAHIVEFHGSAGSSKTILYAALIFLAIGIICFGIGIVRLGL